VSLRPKDTWTVDRIAIAERLGRTLAGKWRWDPFGPDGVVGDTPDGRSVIITAAETPDDGFYDWIHASVARPDRLPSYHDLVTLKAGVWGDDGFAYQVFASSDRHVSIHNFALHLWGRADGRNVLPDFGAAGTI
jgi:hypothetical protein